MGLRYRNVKHDDELARDAITMPLTAYLIADSAATVLAEITVPSAGVVERLHLASDISASATGAPTVDLLVETASGTFVEVASEVVVPYSQTVRSVATTTLTSTPGITRRQMIAGGRIRIQAGAVQPGGASIIGLTATVWVNYAHGAQKTIGIA